MNISFKPLGTQSKDLRSLQEVLGYKPEAQTIREIIAENCSNLGEDMDIQMQETQMSQIYTNKRELYIQLYTQKSPYT